MKKGHDQVLAEVAARKAEVTLWCEQLGANEITLEIGSGHGHFLTAYAKAFPNEICVGVDVMLSRLAKCSKKAKRLALTNIHFVRSRGEEFLEALPSNIFINKVYILFPDPWPKKRHFKHRLIQDDFLSNLASRMHPGGKLYFRTDYEPYFDWTLEKINSHKNWSLLNPNTWDFEESTVFQEFSGNNYQSLVAKSQFIIGSR